MPTAFPLQLGYIHPLHRIEYNMCSQISITACYAFSDIAEDQLDALQTELRTFGQERNMQGLVLIATEGINGTVSGTGEAIGDWKHFLTERFGEMTFKDSVAENSAFKRWSVKIKPEIVALKNANIRPRGKYKSLSPAEWQKVIAEEEVVLLDVRNACEVAIGKFKNAIDPGMRAFSEFTDFAKNAALPKEKKVLMYCTGGIRCEKALLAMEAEGFQNVYQLDGGILAYLEQFPHNNFEGECFIFDHRTAVDQNLQPSSTYAICPHCGNPGDKMITCAHCSNDHKICSDCFAEESRRTCSKRCRNELRKMSAVAAH